MNLYAVMGNPISHSLSPRIHLLFAKQTKLKLHYNKLEISPLTFEQNVIDFFDQKGNGLNITLPFKERAFVMSQVQSARAKEAGAANTLWVTEGKLHADNTDGVGLIRDLNRYINLTDKNILLLGAGGAARGVIGALLQTKPAQFILSNRTMKTAQALQPSFPQITLCEFGKLAGTYDIIINATSASTQNISLPLPEAIFANRPFCYDLAYTEDGNTPFVKLAKAHGCQAKDGIGMLIEQAAESFFIWHGMMPNTNLSLRK